MENQCQCPFCNRKFVVPPALRGKKVKCKQCSGTFVIPDGPSSLPSQQTQPSQPTQPLQVKVEQPVGPLMPNLQGAASAARQCPWCLAALPPGTDDCPHCRAQSRSPLALSPMAGPASKKREPNRAVWIIGAGAGIMGVAIIVLLVMLITKPNAPVTGGPPAMPAAAMGDAAGTSGQTPIATPALPTKLLLKWPDAERAQATVLINNKPVALPSSGVVEYPLPPGSYQVQLRRSGFVNVDTTVELQDGKQFELEPKWKAAGIPLDKVGNSVVTIKLDKSQGSGFVFDAKGVIVTNYHVMEGAKTAHVLFKDGTSLPVTGFLALAPGKDLILIQVQPGAKSLDALQLAPDQPVSLAPVYAFGTPRGLANSMVPGVVSATRSGDDVRNALKAKEGAKELDVYRDILKYDLDAQWIQTTATASPGNSGGPLVNDLGQVVGIMTWRFRQEQQLNFAVSASHIRQLAPGPGAPLRSLADLPPPREGGGGFEGDAQKSLALWNRLGELKATLKEKAAAAQKKIDKNSSPTYANDPLRGRATRIKNAAKGHEELSKAYDEYMREVKSLDVAGVHLELRMMTFADANVAQALTELYQSYARSGFDPATERTPSLDAAYSKLKGLELRLRTEYDLLRHALSLQYSIEFRGLEVIKPKPKPAVKAESEGEEAENAEKSK